MRHRIVRLAAAAVGAAALIGLAAGMAPPAGAATGPAIATKEAAGYQFTGAQFRFVGATVYLRNAAQYASSVGGLGQSVQLWGGGRVYVLGVSDTTSTSPWSPNVAVFNNTTHSLVCAASLANCQDSSGGFGVTSYPAGHTVRESVFYNTGTGALKFVVTDVTAATSSAFTINIGTGVSFRTARVATEYGNDPWTAPASFTAPASRVKTAVFTSGALTNYNGKALTFTSYATSSLMIMTGAGSVTEADAGPVAAHGFTTYLEP